ncbi:ankyrin repeat domain-containing protein [Actinokineospora sp. NBRC 105648]|uniref:ankyrin repeat domain-containing protein n=1 Tax=Actinokineospora sp. NBRC 105648 TaxID=3032206 RepID=UPI0024A1C982|nr:ankyrin repeat domain-containing protein [Actinokineospora sp. NBRC 105648]GLZ43478.1 hypothetical protein Acsp05_71020 [Actinokineospora sp. NBRC 105648]
MGNPEWQGVTLSTTYRPDHQLRRDHLASAARDGEWPTVLRALATSPDLVNAWRPGGTSWYTPVHQAAWQGAGREVVRELLTHGPWLTLCTASGHRALDLAEDNGHGHLTDLLMPVIHNPAPAAGLRRHFHDLIRERAADLVDRERLRLPELEVLAELTEPRMWFPVPGMYGGFDYRLLDHELEVRSWSRIAGGSGQTHRVTADGYRLTESGYG